MAATLNNILNKGSEALANSRVAIDVTGHNISNAHTAGYTRQSVNLETKHPIDEGLHVFGDGARIQSISRVHDSFLEKQIRREVQIQSKNETLTFGLKKLEDLFNPDLTSTIRDRLNSFGNAMREAANYPEEVSIRMNVIESGKALSQAFNSAHAGILQVQTDANEEIKQHAEAVNQKLFEIASLNGQIREMGAGGITSVNDLEDKRDRLIEEVGVIIDINVYKDKNDQYVVRGPNESLLVEGTLSSRIKLDDTYTGSNFPKLLVSEFDKPIFMDISNKTKNSKIGALLEIRDVYGQNLRDQINTLAKGFAGEFNAVHELGYGIGEYRNLKDRNFFTGISDTGEPAQDIHVELTLASEPAGLSLAMSPETIGDNVIANKLVKLFHQPIFENGATASAWYDKIVAKVGYNVIKSREDATASQIVFNKLQAQKQSVSGVSLDDEAANLLKYQHLFSASSRVVTTADEMFKTILDLKR